ncbi:hypothetical protein [Streptomyces sp. NPDC005012]|uniref:hypothetical protein n=1 Tax=unclassified Streptomyces TaxID=2593676 RepID=UPI0033AF59D6
MSLEESAGTQPDLVSSPVRKRAAARALELRLEPGTRKAGRAAETATGRAVKALAAEDGDGWVSGKALREAQEAWNGQVDALMHRLGAERTALGGSARLYTGTDLAVEQGLRRPSPLDSF